MKTATALLSAGLLALVSIAALAQAPVAAPTPAAMRQLSKHKVEHIYRVTGGAHAYPVWQRNLNEVAPMLFPEG